jgi:hypothetical protein
MRAGGGAGEEEEGVGESAALLLPLTWRVERRGAMGVRFS